MASDQDYLLRSDIEDIDITGSAPTAEDIHNAEGILTCPPYWPFDDIAKGYCLLINNLHDQDTIEFKRMIRNDFEFLVAEFSQVNQSTMMTMFRCLSMVDHRYCGVIMVVFLSDGRSSNVEKANSRLTLAQMQSAICLKDPENDQQTRPKLLLCDIRLEHDQQLMFVPESQDNIYQFIFTHFDIKDHSAHSFVESCQLMNFFERTSIDASQRFRTMNEIAECLIRDHIPYQYIGSSTTGHQLSLPSKQTYATRSHEEEGGYAPVIEYKEFVMACMIWEKVRQHTIDSIQKQKEDIQKTATSIRKRKLICAVSNQMIGILTIVVFVLFLFGKNQYYLIFLTVFGMILQGFALLGNAYSIWCTFKKYSVFKKEIEKAKASADVDTIQWKIVEEYRGDYEKNEKHSKSLDTLKDISKVALKTTKNIVNFTFFAVYPIRVLTSIAAVWRTVSFGLRIFTVVALVGSILCVPFDFVEIVVHMKNLIYDKPSKLVKKLNTITDDLEHDYNNIVAHLNKLQKDLYQRADETR